MHAKIIILVILLGIGFGYAVWDTNYNIPVKVIRNTIPNATFKSLEGKKYQIHDFKGKIILLHFWATWCPPCVAEFPELLALAAMQPDELVLIALSVDKSPKDIHKFIKRLPKAAQKNIKLSSVIIAMDNNKTISEELFGTISYPETFIIAPNLTIHKKIAGVGDWTSESMLKALNDIEK